MSQSRKGKNNFVSPLDHNSHQLKSGFICDSFKKSPGRYIFQSLLAMASMALILLFTEFITQAAVVASIGASTFIVFAIPHGTTARTRNIFSGYIIGIICGILLFSLLQLGPLVTLSGTYEFMPLIGGAVAVGLSTFLMSVTSTGHPPAAGVALGFAISGWTWESISFILLFVIILTALQITLRKHLIDLF